MWISQGSLSEERLIFIHQEDPYLLKVKLQRRHTTSKSHVLWISYTEIDIVSWYCRCKTGARVVWVCDHIAAILWYLGYARYRYNIDEDRIGVRDWSSFREDAAAIPEEIDHSESTKALLKSKC